MIQRLIQSHLAIILFAVGAAAFGSGALADSSNSWALAPFVSDGCSQFADGSDENPTQWQHCCVEHDLKYWAGGTWNERLMADEELRDCVADSGSENLAQLMFLGVRLGGGPYLPTPYRWGYGWPSTFGYRELKLEELDQVRRLAPPDLSKVIVVK